MSKTGVVKRDGKWYWVEDYGFGQHTHGPFVSQQKAVALAKKGA